MNYVADKQNMTAVQPTDVALKPMTHVPETGTENPYRKIGTNFSYQMKLEAKLLDLFFYTTVPLINLKAIKQQTTQLI